MIERRQQIQVALQVAGDILATTVAILVAYWLRFEVPIHPITKGTPPLEMYLRLIPVTAHHVADGVLLPGSVSAAPAAVAISTSFCVSSSR